MEIETLTFRLEEIRSSRIKILEEKKTLAEELLARGLIVEIKEGILENMSFSKMLMFKTTAKDTIRRTFVFNAKEKLSTAIIRKG